MRHPDTFLRRASFPSLLLLAAMGLTLGCRGGGLHETGSYATPLPMAEPAYPDPGVTDSGAPGLPPSAWFPSEGSPDGMMPVEAPRDTGAPVVFDFPLGAPPPPPPPDGAGYDTPLPPVGPPPLLPGPLGPGSAPSEPTRPGAAWAGPGMPPPPPPPSWDTRRDRKVARDEGGQPVREPLPLEEPAVPGLPAGPLPGVPVDPGAPVDVGSPDGVPQPATAPGSPFDFPGGSVPDDDVPPPAAPGAMPETPLRPKVSDIPSEAPVALSDDLGDAPAGGSRSRAPAPPPVETRPTPIEPTPVPPPARPAEPVRTPPAPPEDPDPWIRGPTAGAPAVAPPVPLPGAPPGRPTAPPLAPPLAPPPGPGAPRAGVPAPPEDDWISGGTTVPAAPPAPAPASGRPAPVAPPVRPAPVVPPVAPPVRPPTTPAPGSVPPDDPWIDGGNTTAPAPPPPGPALPPSPPAGFPSDLPPTGRGTGLPPLDDQPPAGRSTPVPLPGPAREPPTYEEPLPEPPRGPLDSDLPAVPGRSGFEFSGTPEQRAEEHARRLLAAPEDPSVHGYPGEVVVRADAATALEVGVRPVVILFFDDTARASNLQAAEFLPVLARHREAIDVVAVDVSTAAKWTAAEKKLVKSYYVAYVPTTVVLSAQRKPLLLKYQRISGAVLDAVLEKETR